MAASAAATATATVALHPKKFATTEAAEATREEAEGSESVLTSSEVPPPASKKSSSTGSFTPSVLQINSNADGIEREKWGNKTQFLMSCLASAVGLGNVWRFPAICAKNGGAAFLIPYLIVLLVIAKPLFVLETALGQFSSKGSVRCWDLSPIFRGIGYTGCVSSILLSSFYIMLLAWALIYLALSVWSMFTVMPVWNDPDPGQYFGGKILKAVDFNSPANTTLEPYIPIWHLVLAIVLAWALIWVTMVFGVAASGKVSYVTALVPYVVIVVLLIVGCLLPGATTGMLFLFVPEWSKLLVSKTWFEAVGQCFFSLGVGFGGCIMFSSFNDFHHDLMRDVLIISLADMMTSVLAGFSLLSILGFQATKLYHKQKKEDPAKFLKVKENCKRGNTQTAVKICYLENMVGDEGGAGLAFVQYPAAMGEIQKNWGRPWGGFIGLLFFLMLILLAVGSANGFVGTTVTILCDWKPKWKRNWVVTGVCVFSCFLSLIYTNGLGSGWFDVVDKHGVTAVVYVLSFLEVIAVVYVYGLKNWCDDLQFMRKGKPIGWYLRITWSLLPFFMVVIFIAWLIGYKPEPSWTLAIKIIAWLLTTVVLMVLPLCMISTYLEYKKHPWRKNVSNFRGIVKPSPFWGPRDPEIRREWRSFKFVRNSSYGIWNRFILRRKGEENDTSSRLSFKSNAFNEDSISKIDVPVGDEGKGDEITTHI